MFWQYHEILPVAGVVAVTDLGMSAAEKCPDFAPPECAAPPHFCGIFAGICGKMGILPKKTEKMPEFGENFWQNRQKHVKMQVNPALVCAESVKTNQRSI